MFYRSEGKNFETNIVENVRVSTIEGSFLVQRPAYGGKYCSGPSDDCRLCDLPKCLTPVDLRAQQCTKLGNILYLERVRSNNDVTWLPYVSDQENLRCRLICKSKETGEIFHTRKHLIDGTPCSYGSTNICIQVK